MNPSVSIAICTRDRPGKLRRCLESLTSLRHEVLEILVVDNAPSTEETRRLAEQFRTSYALEAVPGLFPARGRAIAAARGEIIAFTDDDCVAGPGWIKAIREGFADSRVGCVTGKAIAPVEANWAQQQYQRFGRGFCGEQPYRLTAASTRGIYFRAMCGVGANMAFRRDLLRRIGGLPEIAGDCGDDNYMFVHILRAGYELMYHPGSVVYQDHRDTIRGNLIRLWQYGRGNIGVYRLLAREERTPGVFRRNLLWSFGTSAYEVVRSLPRNPLHGLFGLAYIGGLAVGSMNPWLSSGRRTHAVRTAVTSVPSSSVPDTGSPPPHRRTSA